MPIGGMGEDRQRDVNWFNVGPLGKYKGVTCRVQCVRKQGPSLSIQDVAAVRPNSDVTGGRRLDWESSSG